MAAAGKIGDWAFKAFSAGMAVTTVYLTATFSVNLYRGFSWYSAQEDEKKNSIERKAE